MKKYQEFTTVDYISVIAIGFIAVIMVTLPYLNYMQNDLEDRALNRAKSLSLQMASHGLWQLNEKNRDVRVPASLREEKKVPMLFFDAIGGAGEISKDPWEHSYHFKVLNHQKKYYILVWSDGKNQKNETLEGVFSLNDVGALKGGFQGDDLGHIHPFTLDN